MLRIIFIIGPDLYFNVLALSLTTALQGGLTWTKVIFCLEPKHVFCLLSGILFYFQIKKLLFFKRRCLT